MLELIDSEYIEESFDIYRCNKCGWQGIIDSETYQPVEVNFCPGCSDGEKINKIEE